MPNICIHGVVLSLLCGMLCSTVQAFPLSNTSTFRLSKRDYPNFQFWTWPDPNLQNLINAFPDAITLAAGAQNQAEYQYIWDKYFPSTAQAQVLAVFQTIVPDAADPGDGAETLFSCQINGVDIYENTPTPYCGAMSTTFAYTLPFWIGPPAQVTFPASISYYCDLAYTQPLLASDITCANLGTAMSQAMQFLGGTMLHEWMHSPNIGLAAAGVPIVDYNGADGYGVYQCRQLLINNPDACLTNADSYLWLALEIYWTGECGMTFEDPATLNAVSCYHDADPDGAEGYCPQISSIGWCDCGTDGMFPIIPDGQPESPCGYTIAPVTDWSIPSTNCDWTPEVSSPPTCGPYDVSTDDVATMASTLASYAGTMCCSDGSGGCVNVVDTDGVALDLCATDSYPLCIDCGTLATYTTNLASACVSGGMVGGTQAIMEIPGLNLEI